MKLLLLALVSVTLLPLRAADVPTASKTIVTFGDSTTAWRGKLKVYSAWLGELFPSDRVVNRGYPGDTTKAALERFPAEVLAEKPQVVVIQFGINDSAVDTWKTPPRTVPRIAIDDYEKNLRAMIAGVRSAGGEVILMTPNQMRWTDKLRERYGKSSTYDPQDEKGFNKYLAQYVERMREIARDEKVELVDIYAAYDEWEKANAKSGDALLLDGIHPNDQGQKLVADKLEPVLRKVSAGQTKP